MNMFRGMNRILSFAFFYLLCILAGIKPLFAQSDTNKIRQEQSISNVADSEKEQILSRQTAQFQAIRSDQYGDSIRVLELKREILELGTADNAKKQALSAELMQTHQPGFRSLSNHETKN